MRRARARVASSRFMFRGMDGLLRGFERVGISFEFSLLRILNVNLSTQEYDVFRTELAICTSYPSASKCE